MNENFCVPIPRAMLPALLRYVEMEHQLFVNNNKKNMTIIDMAV